jgi:hypothetical protein
LTYNYIRLGYFICQFIFRPSPPAKRYALWLVYWAGNTIDGEIHEGFLDEIPLSSGVKILQAVFTMPKSTPSSAKHLPWGSDPYWLPIPYPKPTQSRAAQALEISEDWHLTPNVKESR